MLPTQDLLKAYLAQKMEELQEEKSKQNTVPNMITRSELFSAIDSDIRKHLNAWFREKRVKVHKTIHAANQDYIEYIKEENNE